MIKYKKVTPEKLEIILNAYLSAHEVKDKTGISLNRIWEVRKENGVKHIRTSRPIAPKEHKDKVKLQASMAAHEQEYLLRKVAKESKKVQALTDAEKIANGYKWTVCDDRGIKCSKLLSPEQLEKLNNQKK